MIEKMSRVCGYVLLFVLAAGLPWLGFLAGLILFMCVFEYCSDVTPRFFYFWHGHVFFVFGASGCGFASGWVIVISSIMMATLWTLNRIEGSRDYHQSVTGL